MLPTGAVYRGFLSPCASLKLWWRQRVGRRIIMCGRRPWRSGFAVSTTGWWVKHVGDVKTAEAQQDSCPRHSAAVIVRNKWWPRYDFHDARWNSSDSYPTRHAAAVEEPLWGGLPVRNIHTLTRGETLSILWKKKKKELRIPEWFIFCRGHILYQHI